MATSTLVRRVTIDIVSDGVCPFCYIGKRRMEQGLRLYQDRHPAPEPRLVFDVQWHPFELDSTLPTKPVSKRAMYAQKFGPMAPQLEARLDRFAQDVGIKFKHDGLTGNTFDYHRLMRHVLVEFGWIKQNLLAEHLFRAYFEEGKALSVHDTLVDGAVAAGLDADQMREFLTSGEQGYEVRGELAEARRRGVRGVPDFTIAGKHHISGAEDPAEFLAIFERVHCESFAQAEGDAASASASAAAQAVAAGTACGIDGKGC
ncbi:hypothetical protein AMAG_09433 [Allomyces macrogynus ATCC 38327]|uniref:DSBA-like thioredoxin domain-containing protein n=1 Tax=Allomyces macrogynus (strain ATCC 38327) TaxID=578462 RepID=A0A0L0SPW1_ALLM3|nr:hypothetical protein AMAG_09433 [Allomyces macrogynus ATCC 38327]|eukprot:KNE64410.1 hypothetical protein AMAG_09433 [Allomyces macrogynus ATCC 38327]